MSTTPESMSGEGHPFANPQPETSAAEAPSMGFSSRDQAEGHGVTIKQAVRNPRLLGQLTTRQHVALGLAVLAGGWVLFEGLGLVLGAVAVLFAGVLGLVFLVAFIAIFFVPSIVAFARDHDSKWGILVVDLLFGMTVVGWIVAFVWALSNPRRAPQVVVNTHVAPQQFMTNYAAPTFHAQQPAPPSASQSVPPQPAPPAAPRYQVGDVVNGHRYNGVDWVPISQ